jgi:isoleucyl-tRNA synthetase
MARTVVRRLNSWRKEVGFNVDDRIEVRYSADPRLAAAIESHAAYIAQETLAITLVPESSEASKFDFETMVGDQPFRANIKRAGS